MRFLTEENDMLKKRVMTAYDTELTLREMINQYTAELEAAKAELDSLKSELRETSERSEGDSQ
jgi:multidrug efflux pump subunit AcrA (membrane-fusion protein)